MTNHLAPATNPHHYQACLDGREPGEVLSGRDQHRLVAELWSWGWTDTQIAAWTRWSTITVQRLRGESGLRANYAVQDGDVRVPLPKPHVGPRLAPCGTVPAYQRHIRGREVPCDPCRLAKNDYQRQWRATRAGQGGAA